MYKSVVLIVVYMFCLWLTELQAQTVKDIDGNIYKTVILGTQIWMSENLITTKYNDGTAIPLVTNDKAWNALKTPAYCWYKNDATANKKTYGTLYNWYTVNTNKLCPIGWHVPTDAEWTALITYLGGESVAGVKLKTTGASHWKSPNIGIVNKNGFAALAGGCRFFNGSFFYRGTHGYWWCLTEYNTSDAWVRYIRVRFPNVGRDYYNKNGGFSVRCLKD